MKVYLLIFEDSREDGYEVIGVYSQLRLAQAAAVAHPAGVDRRGWDALPSASAWLAGSELVHYGVKSTWEIFEQDVQGEG